MDLTNILRHLEKENHNGNTRILFRKRLKKHIPSLIDYLLNEWPKYLVQPTTHDLKDNITIYEYRGVIVVETLDIGGEDCYLFRDWLDENKDLNIDLDYSKFITNYDYVC